MNELLLYKNARKNQDKITKSKVRKNEKSWSKK